MVHNSRKFLIGLGKTFLIIQIKEISRMSMSYLLEDDNSMDEESENPTMEKQLEAQYWFPNNGAPSSSNYVFKS
jgi:hypothetical protein